MKKMPTSAQNKARKHYYSRGWLLKDVLEEYAQYGRDQVLTVLDVYDLSAEPKASPDTVGSFPAALRARWNRTCRQINPRAWEGKEISNASKD